jgi:hypothetical protein
MVVFFPNERHTEVATMHFIEAFLGGLLGIFIEAIAQSLKGIVEFAVLHLIGVRVRHLIGVRATSSPFRISL